MFASFVNPPASAAALSIGDVFSIPGLLGNTYVFDKALPNIFRYCLIPAMENTGHLGVKLKREAERLGLKPAQVAEEFGVKPPSVYDWYEHGRMHKKHYPTLVRLFSKPIQWWLDFPKEDGRAAEEAAVYGGEDQRHKILLALFDGLPSKEQNELIRTLTEKKQHYDSVIEELLSRRNAA